MKPIKNEALALIDYSDEELNNYIRLSAEHVLFSYEDLYKEIQRRGQDRHTQAIVKLTKWAVVLTAIASVSAVVSALAAIVALFKG